MLDAASLAHEASFDICGREVALPRSLEMLRRAESAVGAVAPFAARLDGRQCRVDEIVAVYAALLRDVPGGPTRKEIADWVFARGLVHRDLALYLYSLTLGSDEIERVVKARGLDAAADPGGEPARGPFAMASPTGPSSTASAPGSDGPPPRPAPTRFTR